MRRAIRSLEGRPLRFQVLEPRLPLDAASLRITEFMASNGDAPRDFEGDASDWLEIHNPTASPVDLAGLYLTDRAGNPTKWQFPAGASIAPGDFLIVFASGKDLVAPNGELHANFSLSADGEYLGLIAADGQTAIDAYAPAFPPQLRDISYGLDMSSLETPLLPEGSPARAWRPTSSVHDATWRGVGFDDSVFNIVGNTGFGFEGSPGSNPSYVGQYATAAPSGTTSLYVRAPFAVEDVAGLTRMSLRVKYDDGFVAYLNGVEIASANAPRIRAWNSTATSTHDDFEAIEFQEFDVSTAIPWLVEGDNVLAVHGLNVSAGSSDFLIVPELVGYRADIASPATTGYFDAPTPGFSNGASVAGFAEQPVFSQPHGFYDAAQQVALTTPTPGAVIVYTTDGSTPAVNAALQPTQGQVYTGPIAIHKTTTIRAATFKTDFKPSPINSATYLFVNDVIGQSPAGQAPAGWPSGAVNGQVLDYGIDPQIVALYGADAVKDALLALPTFAITTDVANLFDPATGIYVNADNRGPAWERLASVELIHPDATAGFSTNAGLRIRGGASRNDGNPKHAFRLYFRGEYGDALLDYPLFGEEGAERFDVIDLRTSQNYSWAGWGNSVNGLQNTYLREVFSRDAQADLDQPYTRSRYVHLYLNGQYWGLFMTQERVEEYYGESYFGGEGADYDVVKSDPFETGGTEIADGDDVAWRQLYQLAQQLADNPTAAADNYWTLQGLRPDGSRDENLPVLLDVANLIDYMMIIFYTGGHDTGISAFFGNQRANNWFGIRNRETGDQGFQFFLHDNEHSLAAGELVGALHGTFNIDRTGPFFSANDRVFEQFNPAFLHQDLLAHPEYRQRFVDRVQELMFGDGPLTPDANAARMAQRKAEVEGAIIAEAARWGDAKRSVPYNKTDWDDEVAWLFDVYFPQRGDMVVGQLRAKGLYNQSGAPSFSLSGGEVAYGYPLQLDAAAGTIYYSTDGATDPRRIGGGVNPSAQVQAYDQPIVLTQSTEVWARLREPSGAWSGLMKASFVVRELAGDFDRNGIVNQQDYDLWRATFGSTDDLRADGNRDGFVDAADYTVWRNGLTQQPAIASPAQATPAMVTGVSTQLSALGALPAGEDKLIYSWTASGPADVTFSATGNNAAKETVATFSEAGEYVLSVVIENSEYGSQLVSSVPVVVQQTVSGIAVSPAATRVAAGSSVQLAAFAADQFGDPVDAPGDVAWSVAVGAGSVNQAGVFQAYVQPGTVVVRATSPLGVGQATLEVAAPLAWYRANETSGTTLVDSAGNGRNGSLVGASGWQTGVGGNSLQLTGGYANLPAGIVSGANDLTIAAWINLSSVDTWSRVFDFGSGTNVNMFLTPRAGGPGGPLRFAITTSGGGGEQQLDGPVLVAGQWYHVAVTLEGNLGTLYVNGLPVAANPNMTLNPSQMGTTTANFLGNSQYSADPRLRGRIDDLRIYSVGLSADQIARLARPVVVTPAAANEPTSGGAVTLSVLGSDLTAGDALLRYTWTTVGSPPGPVSFSLNGTSAAQQTVANFSAAGDYVFQATIANPVTGLTATSTVTVSVTLAASVQAADAALETWSLAGRFADGQIPRGFRPPLRAAWPARLS